MPGYLNLFGGARDLYIKMANLYPNLTRTEQFFEGGHHGVALEKCGTKMAERIIDFFDTGKNEKKPIKKYVVNWVTFYINTSALDILRY